MYVGTGNIHESIRDPTYMRGSETERENEHQCKNVQTCREVL